MRKVRFVTCLVFLAVAAQISIAQTLPVKIKSYLNQHYEGWKPEKGCEYDTNGKTSVSGDFNGDRKLDYAVKFSRGKKGYIVAFLAQKNGFKPYVLHNTDVEEVRYSTLGVLKKGNKFSYEGVNSMDKLFRLKYDAPSDYHCESDVGGIHYYRNGKFVGY